jgi:DNA-binding Xre family transcriptional regulator
VTGELSREHWIVPVHGLTQADPDGIVHATARRDGTVILRLVCGDSQTTMRLDVSRAAQLSTGIWEAAGAAQQLTGYLDDDQPPPPQPLSTRSGVRPVARQFHPHRSTPPQDRSPRLQRRPSPVNTDTAIDAVHAIGLRIRRIRKGRDKSLRVLAGLAGMSSSTLHRVEHGQRDVTLSEIVALANTLEIRPSTLIELPILAQETTEC